jgi:hypothetical protein
MILSTWSHGTRWVRAMALVCVPAWLLSVATHAAPAPEAPPATPEAVPSAGKSRASIEEAMAELGRLTSAADTDKDVVRAACLVDKQERGREVMELVTGELLVVNDGGSTDQQRQFATEKLGALSDRMTRLVEEARSCTGDTGPERKDDKTRTQVDERPTVPYADPTAGGIRPPVPPPVDDGKPPTVESPTN